MIHFSTSMNIRDAYWFFIIFIIPLFLFVVYQLFYLLRLRPLAVKNIVIHISIATSVIVNTVDELSRMYVDDTNSRLWGLCGIPQAFVQYSLTLGFSLALYNWIFAYYISSGFEFKYVRVGFIVFLILLGALLMATSFGYCREFGTLRGERLHNGLVISSLLANVIVGVGFVIYGLKILVIMKKSPPRLDGNSALYTLTVQTVIFSLTVLLVAALDFICYISFKYLTSTPETNSVIYFGITTAFTVAIKGQLAFLSRPINKKQFVELN